MTCNICAKTWCAPNQHCYDSHFLNCKGIENDEHKHTSNTMMAAPIDEVDVDEDLAEENDADDVE
jgi:hypothetical protein